MATVSDKKWETVKKRRNIVLIALVLLCGYLLLTSVSLNLRLREQKKQLAYIEQQIRIAQEANDELRRILQGSQEEYMERIAREKLGYAAVGESVYEDISGID